MKKILDTLVHSPNETFQLGFDFSSQLRPGAVLSFKGDLGAGKTTCIKGICAGLDVAQPVTSPTFTLINEYKGRVPVFHFDFYRIQSLAEVTDMGLTEYFEDDGVCLIEWPEVVEALLPVFRFEFHLKWEPTFDLETRSVAVFAGQAPA